MGGPLTQRFTAEEYLADLNRVTDDYGMNTTGLRDTQIAYCGRLEISDIALEVYNRRR